MYLQIIHPPECVDICSFNNKEGELQTISHTVSLNAVLKH